MNNLTAQLEALLFIYGEQVEVKKIAKILKQEVAEVEQALTALKEKLVSGDRGLSLIFSDSKVQLTTKPEFSRLFEDLIKDELTEALTPAALETLSIIAYGGPLSRSIIDYIRGVNSTFILRALLIRGLIERHSDPKRPNAYIYSPSFELLRHLGLSTTKDLPEYNKFREIVTKLMAAN